MIMKGKQQIVLIVDDTPNVITVSGFSPIRRHIAKKTLDRLILDGRIHPTKIEDAIPLAVVFFQKSNISIAGRFAEAAIANAHPTRNDTFIPLNIIPKIIARIPIPTAAIFPIQTFLSLVISIPM